MSPDPVERLRERVRKSLDALAPNDEPHVPEEAVYVMAAIVEELGVTEEDVTGVTTAATICRNDGWYHLASTVGAQAHALGTLLRTSRT